MLSQIVFNSFSHCSLKEGLDFVTEAIGRTGYNDKIKIAVGVAATEFCIGSIPCLKKWLLPLKEKKKKRRSGWIKQIREIAQSSAKEKG